MVALLLLLSGFPAMSHHLVEGFFVKINISNSVRMR